MGWFDNLFGKKAQCAQCNRVFPQKQQHAKRGKGFCSDACAQGYHQANPMPLPSGDPGSLAAEALSHVKRGCDALSVLLEAFTGMDDMSNQVLEYEQNMMSAMPYLYALGMEAEADELASYDFETLHGMSSLAGGAVQYARILRIAKPPVHRCKAVIEALQGR